MEPGTLSGSAVTVAGDREVAVTAAPEARERFGWTTREFAIHCHTGRVIEGRWSGYPVASLTEAARAAPGTTHLLVTGHDGHRACVPVAALSDALLAFAREAIEVTYPDDWDGDGPEGGTQDDRGTDGTPRFLAQGVDSSHTVRDVATIEAVSLAPDEDPRSYETGE